MRRVKEWRKKTKGRLIAGFGGKCCRCGYSGCDEAMDFHHIDETKKSFGLSAAMASPRRWNDLVEEAQKCVLLCCRCHRELHAGIWDLSQVSAVPFTGEKVFSKKDTVTGKCPQCNRDVFYNHTYCGRSCAGRARPKGEWPDDKTLLEMASTQTKSSIAAIVGVTEAAVRKRLNRLIPG